MKKIAYIFPGQGAQYVGMGKELCGKFSRAKNIFEKANQVLGFDITRICFEGPLEKLTQSAVCQPAILTFSVAVFEVFKNEIPVQASACLGLSLGEYSALVSCGSLRFEDAVTLVNKRGQFMDEASRENPGTMICVLGIDIENMKDICRESGAEIANLNCPGQIIVSGSNSAIAKAGELAQKAGAKKIIPLEVSGPFHCSLMNQASQKLKTELDKINIASPLIPFIPNVTADYEKDTQRIKFLLTEQVCHTTYWGKSITLLKNNGICSYFEMGPGKVLRGLLQRINRELQVVNLEKDTDFIKLKDGIGR